MEALLTPTFVRAEKASVNPNNLIQLDKWGGGNELLPRHVIMQVLTLDGKASATPILFAAFGFITMERRSERLANLHREKPISYRETGVKRYRGAFFTYYV